MAHDIAVINGQAAMAYVGDSPWHRLGTEMHGFPTVEAAMEAASLDWKVKLQNVYLRNKKVVPNCRAVVRDADGAVLATVGNTYEPLQNREAFGVLDVACEQFGVHIETMGALGKGDRVWALAKLPTVLEPVQGDRIETFALITSGHNGWTAYEYRLTNIRVVCSNTLSYALSQGKSMIKLRHVKSQIEQIELVSAMVTDLIATAQETGKQYTQLASKKLNLKEISQYINSVLSITEETGLKGAVKQKRDDLVALATGAGVGTELAPFTAWTAYNAVTEYVDHVIRKNAKANLRQQQADTSAVFGANRVLKQKAFDRAMELVVVR